MGSFLEETQNKNNKQKNKKKKISTECSQNYANLKQQESLCVEWRNTNFMWLGICSSSQITYYYFVKKDKYQQRQFHKIKIMLGKYQQQSYMSSIQEEVSIEGRLTQFQMEFIKGRELIPTKQGSDFNEQSFIKKKLIDKLRSNTILILKEKIKIMEKFTIETQTILNQKVGQLECEVAEREAEIKDLKQEIKKIKKEFSTILKHTQFLNNYISQQKQKKKQRFKERLSSKQKKVGLSPNIKAAKSNNKLPERLSIKLEKGKQKVQIGRIKSLELIKIPEGVKKYRKQETQRLWR